MRVNHRLLLAAALLVPLLMGGRTHYVGNGLRVVLTASVRDLAAVNAEYHSPCSGIAASGAVTDADKNCFVPEGYTFLVQSFSVNAADTLLDPGGANSEQCEILVETNSTGSETTGTDIATSSIQVGVTNANPVGTCLSATTVVIDSKGEGCTRDIDPTDTNATVAEGGWFRINFDVPNGTCVGNCTCDSLASIDYTIIGTFFKEM